MASSVILALLLLLLPLSVLAPPVHAASAIVVTATRDENHYPTDARFFLEAHSDSDITKVSFNYQFVGSDTSAYMYPQFTPSREVKIEHRWDTRLKYAVPGSEMEYYWQLEDASGNVLKTQPTRFTFEDTRFKWQSVTSGLITLQWYEGGEGFGHQLLDASVNAAGQLSQSAGVEITSPIKIMLYATQRDMMGALEQGAQEWTGGRSFSDMGIVVIAAGSDPGGRAFGLRAVPHELSHVIVHRATDNPYSSLPPWLDEGLAMYAEGTQEASYGNALNRAVTENRLISLRSLSSSFPADPNQARLSYAESYSVVKFIIDQYGRDGMGKLLKVFAQGNTPDRALQQSIGTNLAGLEAQWRASLGAAPLPTARPGATNVGATPPVASNKVPAPASVATPAPSGTNGTTPAAAPSGSLPWAAPLAALVLVVIAGLGGGMLLRRRRGPNA
ncbi:MAG: peptidase MA family metallohydrolase [Chloroflexi bacterium]|nr:peptidase MA family metallohydrolase [Chloroflexota bacterium]